MTESHAMQNRLRNRASAHETPGAPPRRSARGRHGRVRGRRPLRRGALLIAGIALALQLAPAAGSPVPGLTPPLDPSRVTWTSLTFRASKLGLSTTAKVELGKVPAARASGEMIVVEDAPGIPPRAPETFVSRVRTSFLGRDSLATLWFDPRDGEALQRYQLETGRRHRFKAYRFSHRGVHTLRRYPADGEEDLPHERWSDRSQRFDPYPEAARNLAVIEPAALFYVLSAADLSSTGDLLKIPAYSRSRVILLEIRVEGLTRLPVDYQRDSGNGDKARVRGDADVLHLTVHPRPWTGAEDADFELIGLRGDVDVFLDLQTRVPVEVQGKVKIAGRVHIRLQEVVAGTPAGG